jgi:hypothetical protein
MEALFQHILDTDMFTCGKNMAIFLSHVHRNKILCDKCNLFIHELTEDQYVVFYEGFIYNLK